MQYRISKNEINLLPRICYPGKIEEIYLPDRLDEILGYLKNFGQVGFDTESRPAFKKGQVFPISVIQLATDEHAFLIRNQFTGITDSFSDYMSSSQYQKIGLALRDDTRKLRKLGIQEPDGFVDISKIAQQKGIIQIGARALTARYMKRHLSKSVQTSNWAKKKLNDKQLKYAATDAWICLKIFPELLDDQTDYHHLEKIHFEEFETWKNHKFYE